MGNCNSARISYRMPAPRTRERIPCQTSEPENQMTDDERDYYNRPSRESAFLCMAICGACALVLAVVAMVMP